MTGSPGGKDRPLDVVQHYTTVTLIGYGTQEP